VSSARSIVVVGGGGHGKVLLNLLARLPGFKVLGYVDPRDNGSILGFPRIGGDDALPGLAGAGAACAVLGMGKVMAGGGRLAVFRRLRELGFALPPIIAPTSVVAGDAVLGEGTVIMDGAVIQPGCVVGMAAIINTGAILDHDCTLGDDTHIATAAALCGNVSVGDGSVVGAGATVIQGVRITSGCLIGAGAAVADDCTEPGLYLGVPARRVRP
jgi:UDP-perosamine 4-acetyltransferase